MQACCEVEGVLIQIGIDRIFQQIAAEHTNWIRLSLRQQAVGTLIMVHENCMVVAIQELHTHPSI